MDLNRLTQKSQDALHHAQTKASRFGHQEMVGEHLLLALIDQPDGIVPRLVTEQARRHIAQGGFAPAFGARPLYRYLPREVETRKARTLLSGNGAPSTVDLSGGDLTVTWQQAAEVPAAA